MTDIVEVARKVCAQSQAMVDAKVAEAVAAERERCAKAIEDYNGPWDSESLAAAIRKGE